MSSTQLRTYTGIEYILYMYNLGTAPNVQNWPGFAVCTPGALARACVALHAHHAVHAQCTTYSPPVHCHTHCVNEPTAVALDVA